jgi:hypothetical protein
MIEKPGQLLHDQLVQDLEWEKGCEMRYRAIVVENPSAASCLDGTIDATMKRVIALEDALEMLRAQEDKVR